MHFKATVFFFGSTPVQQLSFRDSDNSGQMVGPSIWDRLCVDIEQKLAPSESLRVLLLPQGLYVLQSRGDRTL